MRSVDVAALIDEGRFTPHQKALVAGTALMIILDGVDGQLLGNAVPAMMREWDLPRSAFATASAAAPFGMMLGGIVGGLLGDRIGRRATLQLCVFVFGLLTLAVALVNSLALLATLRFVAGMGLGGAMPNAAALVSEYVPRRQRPMAITLTIVCIPLGGFLAGLLAGQVVPGYGWRVLFVLGGVMPLALVVLLARQLPESPRYLVAREARWPELRALLRRIGHDVSDADRFVEGAGPPGGPNRGSIPQLFSKELARDTLWLMGAFASCLLAIWIGFLWIPAMLTDPAIGFSQPAASYALSLFNFGGVGGALVGAVLIQRFGSRPALLAMTALTITSSLVMSAMPLDPRAPLATMTMFTLTGGLMNAVQTTMYALAAHVFPTSIRGTGVGTTVAVGRTGNVLASYVGSWALSAGGPRLYFLTWAAALTMVFISLALVRRHIPKTHGPGIP